VLDSTHLRLQADGFLPTFSDELMLPSRSERSKMHKLTKLQSCQSISECGLWAAPGRKAREVSVQQARDGDPMQYDVKHIRLTRARTHCRKGRYYAGTTIRPRARKGVPKASKCERGHPHKVILVVISSWTNSHVGFVCSPDGRLLHDREVRKVKVQEGKWDSVVLSLMTILYRRGAAAVGWVDPAPSLHAHTR
jgi:hypothetical protein